MPRVFRPKSSPSPYQTNLVEGFIQVEIVVGGMALAAGGFLLRETGRYDGLVVGGTLLVLGLYRLWKRYDQRTAARRDTDRVLTQLQNGLSADHTVSLDYPLNGDRIPYLVLGPAGVFVVGRFEHRGYFTGDKEQTSWQRWPEDPQNRDDAVPSEEVPNPISENRRRVRELRGRLRDCARGYEDLEPVSRVVIIHGRVEGPIRDYEELCSPGELAAQIRSHESGKAPLDWEALNQLEESLGLREYE